MPGRLLVLALNVGGCRGVAPVGGGPLCRPGALWKRRLLPLHPLPTALATAAVSPQHGALQAISGHVTLEVTTSSPGRLQGGWLLTELNYLQAGLQRTWVLESCKGHDLCSTAGQMGVTHPSAAPRQPGMQVHQPCCPATGVGGTLMRCRCPVSSSLYRRRVPG